MTRRARDPRRPTVTLIPGDGIGPEVTSAAVEVLEAAGASLEWDVQLAGKAAFERGGDPIPEALLASLNGNGHGYDVAAKFLEIAVANATDAQIKGRLQKALEAAQRELRYDASHAAADAAADRGEFEKAAALYEDAWTAIPARSSNGMEAASTWLLHDDTAKASALLIRLRASADPDLAPLAGAMLKELEPIEPAAKIAQPDAGAFFRDAGSTQPVILSALIPPVDTTNMELLARPLPKLVPDPEPVVLLAALSAVPGEPAAAAALPEMPPPSIAGENPWREAQQLLARRATETPAAVAERPMSTGDISGSAKVHHPLQVTSRPAGARISIGDHPEPVCETPCTIEAAPGSYFVRVTLAGYREMVRETRVTAKGAEVDVALDVIPGNVAIEAPGATALKVNGVPVPGQAPLEVALTPGLYRIGAEFGQSARERTVNVKPGARLRLELRP